MISIITRLLPFFTAAAANGTQLTTNGTMTTIIQWVGGIGGGIIAVLLIVSIVKDAAQYATGNGQSSVWKIVGKVLFLLLMIGLIIFALNYANIANSFGTLAQDALDTVNSEVQGVI